MCARWPEPGVHLIERPPRRLDRKGSDHPLRQPVEIGSRAQRLPAVGLGVVMAGKEEDDIQVRRGRQRAATQPPQPQYDEPAAIHLAVDRFELRRRRLREREDRGFGEAAVPGGDLQRRSEEHTSELQSLMRISYAVFCLKKKT